MKALLLPLDGSKYYGTQVKILGDAGETYVINIWNSGSWEPSDRECGLAGITIDQWRTNESIPVRPGESYPARDLLEICDGHFESRETHALAEELVRRINRATD